MVEPTAVPPPDPLVLVSLSDVVGAAVVDGDSEPEITRLDLSNVTTRVILLTSSDLLSLSVSYTHLTLPTRMVV